MINGLKNVSGLLAKQFGHHGLHAFERIGQGAGLFENFFLHVVAIWAEFGGTAVGMHGFDGALSRRQALSGVFDPVFAQLRIHHIAFFQIDDLVGYSSQRHGVAGQVMGAIAADAHNQW